MTNARILTVPTIISIALLAVTLTAQTPEAAFAAGRQAMISGQHEQAVQHFEKAVKLRPSSADYHYWLGGAYGNAARTGGMLKQASNAKKARVALERAVELDGKHIDARLALIDFYMIAPGFMGGSEKKAIEQATEIRKLDSLHGHRALARIYQRQKKVDQARNEMITAVREQPNSAKAHYYYGSFLMNEKNYKGALQELETAVRLDPSYMLPFYRLGTLAVIAENHYARGEEGLKKYLGHTPADDEPAIARAWYWLGQLYEKQGRHADAKQSYQTSLKLAPGAKDVTEALKRLTVNG